MNNSGEGRGAWVFSVIGVLAVLTLIFCLFGIRVVDQSETCTRTRLGTVIGVETSGLKIINPLTTKLDCYQASATFFQTGENENKDADYWDYMVEIKTQDGQTGSLSFNILYRINPEHVVRIRREIAQNKNDFAEKVIANFARSIPRNIAAKYDAEGLYGGKRVDYSTEVEDALRIEYEQLGAELISFELRDVQFNPAYEEAIENQQIEEERVTTAQNQAEQQKYVAEGKVTESRGKAQSEIEEAKGYAEAAVIKAEADAKSLELIAKALSNNPDLLTYEYIQKLAPNVKVLMLPNSGDYILPLPSVE